MLEAHDLPDHLKRREVVYVQHAIARGDREFLVAREEADVTDPGFATLDGALMH